MLSSIKTRIMLLATIPVIATTIVLAAYFIHGQLRNADQALDTHGDSTARHLARACEYGVFAGNPDILRPLVISALEEDAVISVTVTDQLGAAIIQESKTTSTGKEAYPEKSEETLTFSHAITLLPIEVDEMEADQMTAKERDPPEVLGWVIVKLSTIEANKKRAEAIRNTLIITFIGIALSILLALHFSRRITSPLLRLTNTVREIEAGNLETEISTTSTGEIGSLETGIGSMVQSIRDSRGSLQKQVDKATTDLRHSLQIVEQQNIELRNARQEALIANNAKSVFLANVSHEIRTPLNGIIGFVRLLRKSGLRTEQEDYAVTIEKSADSLLYLIGDILDLSRIESGKVVIQDIQFNLRECIEDIVTLLAPSAYDKSLDISSIFYDDVPTLLLGAPDRVRQILINLVGNAIKFSYKGTIVIRTSLEEEEDDDLIIRISVTDQGIGISQQDRDLLFNSFCQLDNSTTRRYGGAGLGLSISKSLAEMMGGKIDVESSQDKGSTFWFTFRARRIAGASREATSPILPFNGYFALLYDEAYHSGIAIMHQLRSFGFEIYTSDNPDDLRQRLTSLSKIDLIVLRLSKDEDIPENLQYLLSAIKHYSQVKTLCFINSADPITLLRVREQGIDACLPTSMRAKEVLESIKALLPAGQSKVQTRKHSTSLDGGSGPAAGARKSNVFDTSLSSIKILIAEDNDINAKLLCTILDQTKADYTLVQDGKQAVELFTRENYDIILMDVHMPEKNGVQATAEIRELEADNKRIPIIGLTASVLANERKMYLNAGMDDLLVKPVAIDLLLHTIHLWTCGNNGQSQKGIPSGASQAPSSDKVSPYRDTLVDRSKLTRTLLDMLIDEIPQTRDNLQQAFDNKDWAQLRELVHKLLGGLGYCDVPALRASVENLQNKLHPVSDTLPKALENVFDEMKWLVDRYRGDDGI